MAGVGGFFGLWWGGDGGVVFGFGRWWVFTFFGGGGGVRLRSSVGRVVWLVVD